MPHTCLLLTMVKIIAKRQENIQCNVQLTCEGITFIFNGSAIELETKDHPKGSKFSNHGEGPSPS